MALQGAKLSKAIHRIDALTLRRIATGKFKGSTKSIHDGGSLYIRLRDGGGSWMFRFQAGGRLHTMGLGSVAQVGAPEARAMARDFRTKLTLGLHPLHERREERRRLRAEQRNKSVTFQEVAEQVLETYSTSNRAPKTLRSWRQVIRDYAYPKLGNMLLEDIEQADIVGVLRPIWGVKPDVAQKLRGRIEHIFDEARVVMKITSKSNPARHDDLAPALAPFASTKPESHHKALPWREVPALMARLRGKGNLSAYALRLTILSACRTREVLGARFDEFADGIWTVAAERMKGDAGRRRPHRVPISSGVAALVEELEPGRQRSPLLFASRSATKPLSDTAMWMHLKSLSIDCTVHGFRSAFRDFAADNNFPREVAEAALAHRVQGVEAAYFRSDVIEARKALMQRWSDFCLSGATPKPGARRK